MNKIFLDRNIFESLNGWNIIILVIQTKHYKSEKDDEAFKIIISGVETRMNEKILTAMYWAIRTYDESTDGSKLKNSQIKIGIVWTRDT